MTPEILLLVAEDLAELLDPLEQVSVPLLDLLDLERGKPAQRQLQNSGGLNHRQLKALDEPLRAVSGSRDPRIRAITSSRLASAISRPS